MPNIPNLDVDEKLMPGDVARIFGVTTKTVATMPGLNPIILPSGHRRYLKSEVDALVEKRNGEVAA